MFFLYLVTSDVKWTVLFFFKCDKTCWVSPAKFSVKFWNMHIFVLFTKLWCEDLNALATLSTYWQTFPSTVKGSTAGLAQSTEEEKSTKSRTSKAHYFNYFIVVHVAIYCNCQAASWDFRKLLSLIEITIEAKQNNGKYSLVYLSTVMDLCMFSRHLILSGYFYFIPFDFFHINKFQRQMSRFVWKIWLN